MPRKLQTWAVVADGRNRLIVATESRREAARLCGVSDHTMKLYGNTTSNREETRLAGRFPGVVWTQPSHGRDPFVRADVKPYVVRHVAGKPPLREVANDRRTVEDCRAKWEGVPHREVTVKGKPMADLTGAVMQDARMGHMTAADVRLVLHVLDDIGAGLVVPPFDRNAALEALYTLSLNEEAMETAEHYFEGSSTGEALKVVFHACKQLRTLLLPFLPDGGRDGVQPVSKKDGA